MQFVIRLFVSALAFLALSELLPGIEVASFTTALVLALLWGVIGVTVKPLLLILTLPINLLTLGIFTFILNGFLLWVLGGLVDGFTVSGFWIAVLGALILSIISMAANFLIERVK